LNRNKYARNIKAEIIATINKDKIVLYIMFYTYVRTTRVNTANSKTSKAVVDSILRPRCALPSSPFPGRQCIFNGEENPFPAIGDAAYSKHVGGAPATDIGNMHMHKKFGKDRACGSGDILADTQTDPQTDRQTDRHTHHKYSSQPLPLVEYG